MKLAPAKTTRAGVKTTALRSWLALPPVLVVRPAAKPSPQRLLALTPPRAVPIMLPGAGPINSRTRQQGRMALVNRSGAKRKGICCSLLSVARLVHISSCPEKPNRKTRTSGYPGQKRILRQALNEHRVSNSHRESLDRESSFKNLVGMTELPGAMLSLAWWPRFASLTLL